MKLCPSTHTHGGSLSVRPQTFRKGCASFHRELQTVYTVPVLRFIYQCEQILFADNYPALHPARPSMTQHGSAWHSRAWQCYRALKVSIPLHESGDKPSCIFGFSLCTAGGYQWGIEFYPWFCLPAPVVIHLTFVPQEILKTAVWSCSAAFLILN